MKPLAGSGLLLTGSGIYWILSSQLIASFTVLMPELFRGTSTGTALVLVAGIFASTLGLWTINVDADELSALFFRKDGWIFTIPLILVPLDISLTIFGLTHGTGIVELNPFVSAAFHNGTGVLTAFVIAYMGTFRRCSSPGCHRRTISARQKTRKISPLLSYLRGSIIRPPQQPLPADKSRSDLEHPRGNCRCADVRDLGIP